MTACQTFAQSLSETPPASSYRDIFSSRRTIRFQHHLDASIYVSAYGRHPGDQRPHRTNHRAGDRCESTPTLSELAAAKHCRVGVDREYHQYWSRSRGHGGRSYPAHWRSTDYVHRFICRSMCPPSSFHRLLEVRLGVKVAHTRPVRLFWNGARRQRSMG